MITFKVHSVKIFLESIFIKHCLHAYRVTQQCCPGGNRPETPRRPSAGGLRIFWAKSLVIPAIYTKFKLMAHKFKLKFCMRVSGGSPDDFRRDNIAGSHGMLNLWAISLNFVYMAGITSDLAKWVVRTISTGTTLLVHTVVADFGTNWSCNLKNFKISI